MLLHCIGFVPCVAAHSSPTRCDKAAILHGVEHHTAFVQNAAELAWTVFPSVHTTMTNHTKQQRCVVSLESSHLLLFLFKTCQERVA